MDQQFFRVTFLGRSDCLTLSRFAYPACGCGPAVFESAVVHACVLSGQQENGRG